MKEEMCDWANGGLITRPTARSACVRLLWDWRGGLGSQLSPR